MASNKILYDAIFDFEGHAYKLNGDLVEWTKLQDNPTYGTMRLGIYTKNNQLGEIVGLLGDREADLPECSLSFESDGRTLYLWLFDEPVDVTENYDTLADLVDAVNTVSGLEFDTEFAIPKSVKIHGDKPYYFVLDELQEAPEVVAEVKQAIVSDKILNHTISLASAKGRSERHWNTNKSTVHEFIEFISTHVESKDKDGFAILQGSLVGKDRKAQAVKQLDLMILDLDTGESMQKIEDRIRDLGLFCIMYTTHSHLKPTTDVKLDALVRFIKEDREITLSDVKAYLTTEKRYQPEILDGASIGEPEHKADGIVYTVKHKPMPKFRLIFLLDEPFIIAQRGGSQKAAIDEWKGRYVGLANHLHAAYDRSCVDPSRLMYTPRHPPGAKEFSVKVIAGKPLDIETIEVANFKSKSGPRNAFEAAAGSSGSKEYKTPWLMSFAAKFAGRFEGSDLAADYYPVIADNGNSRSVECPNSDNHSDSSDKTGFFCVNASDSPTDSFVMKCQHDSCSELDRLGFLDLIITDNNLTSEDIREYISKTEDDEDEEDPVAEEPLEEGELPSDYTNYEEATAYLASYKIGSLSVDAVKKMVKFLAYIPLSQKDTLVQGNILAALNAKSASSKSDINRAFKEACNNAKVNNNEFTSDEFECDANKEYRKVMDKMCKEYALVSLGPVVKIAHITQAQKKGSMPKIDMINPDSFRLKLSNQNVKTMIDGEAKKLTLGDAFIQYPRRKTYDRLVFEPDESTTSPENLNLWSGFPIEGKQGDFPLIHQHIYEVLCRNNDEYYNWLMTWLAHIIQYPGKKPGSAVVIKGEKGTGKSIIFETLMKRLLNDYHYKCANSKTITSNFNFQFHSKLFVLLEEAVWGGDSNAEGVLKDMITSDTMQYEKKGETPYMDSSYVRIAMLSNTDWVVPASADERRFFVLEASSKYQQQHEYFDVLNEEIHSDKALRAFMWELENWSPEGGWSILYTPPKTEWLYEQQSFSNTGMDEFFISLLDSNQLEEDERHPNKPLITFSDTEPNRIPKQAFKNHFMDFMSRGGGKGRGTLANFKKYTSKWLYTDVVSKDRDRENIHGGMIEFITVPPLNELRKKLKAKGHLK